MFPWLLPLVAVALSVFLAAFVAPVVLPSFSSCFSYPDVNLASSWRQGLVLKPLR